MLRKLIMLISCLFLATAIFVPPSHADQWSKKTIFTFNEPVEVPGRVLPAGTYVFKLANFQSDRDIVQIFDKTGMHFITAIMAIPDYRMNPTDKTVVSFEERPKDSPEAVATWFYPGDDYGLEFVYPKAKALLLAKANNRPVLAHEASPEAKPAELKTTPVKAVGPTGEEIQVAKVVAPPPVQTAQMPHTASDLPLLALLGFGLLGSAFLLPRIARAVD